MLEERHNFLLFSRTAYGTFRHANWDKAYRSRGIFGVAVEFLHSLVGTNTWPFFIERTPRWGREQIQSLLGAYGIEMWGWGYHAGRYFFRVRKDKAHWAQHILLSNSVPVSGRLLDAKGRHN